MKAMTKRIISLALCFVMFIGLLPLNAYAEEATGEDVTAQVTEATEVTEATQAASEEPSESDEEAVGFALTRNTSSTIYVLAGGDFQEAGDHANSAANVTNILAQVSKKYTTMDGFLFIGDYDCETHDNATETANGITALMGAVQGKYSNINDANSVLVQGNHDYMDSRIDVTGGHDFDVDGDGVYDYSAYVLNEDDYPNGGGSQSGVQTLANNLKTWLNNKIGEGYDAPIFIVSHLPLAFTPRTVSQGDAKYAKYIFDVLNEAGTNNLNIIFLHGHDHAYGPDNYMGGEAIYLAEGDKICIAEAGSTSKWTEETLNFTYMNAGYVGYYSDPMTYVTTAGTDKLTMTVFAITGSEVTVERYSEDGLYNLKSAGYDGSYSNTSVTNVSLGLPKYEKVYTSPQTITLTAAEDYGTIGEDYVPVKVETPADDVTTANNGWVEIIAPTLGNSGTDDVTTSGNSWVTITDPVPGTPATEASTTYKYVLDQDGVNTNTKYLIVNTSSDGTAYVLTNNNGSVAATQVTISNGEIVIADETNVAWTFSGTTSGTVGNQGRYIYPNNGSISLNTSGSNMTIGNEGNGGYQIYRRGSNFDTNYYWIAYGSSWTGARSYMSRDIATIYLFAYDSTINTPATEATPDQNGLYGYVSGELTYNFPTGTDADTALAAVKAGIDVRYLEAMSTPGADATYQVADDGIITWTLDPNYDPNTPGDYVVTISYNDVVLGKAEVVLSSGDTNGTYGKIDGILSYEVALGTSAERAMATVKDGIDGYYYNGMSTPDVGETGTKVDDAALKWEWVDTYSPTTPGDYEIKISYTHNGVDYELGTAEVVVPAATLYYIAEGNELYLVDMNTSADAAMAAVKAGVTVYSATDANGTAKTAISDDEVEWEWVDTYNPTTPGEYTVEILKNGNSLGTVEVKVNVYYETGIEDGWTYVGESEATGGTHTYTLDTDGIEYGEENKYIIVAANQAIALHATSSSNGTAETITINGNTATTTTRDYEYHVLDGYSYDGTAYHLITKGDGSQYLYQEGNGVRYGTRSSVKFAVEHMGNGQYRIRDIDGTQWCVVYNGSWTVLNNTNHPERVRFYKYTGTTGGTPAGPIHVKIEGDTIYTVEQGTSATKALAAVKAGITGYISSSADGSNPTVLEDSDLEWTWKSTYNSMHTGSYWVEICYKGSNVVLGTVQVKVVPAMVNNYPEYPNEGAVKVTKTATGVDFQSTGVAQVELAASGVPIKKGVDLVIMVDTSSSMTSWCVCGKQNCTSTETGHARRSAVLEESLKNLIAQLKTPGPDGQVLDIDVAIADFNGFYGENQSQTGTAYDRAADDVMNERNSDNNLIYYNAASEAIVYTNGILNADGTYTTGSGTLDATAFLAVEDLAASYTLNYTSGTNYDYAMDAIYQLATAKQAANGGEDRDLFVVFLSDGAPMQWNYYHSQGASVLWNSWITGSWPKAEYAEVDGAVTRVDANYADVVAALKANLNCTDHAYYYDEIDHDGDGQLNEHRMANAIKGDPGSLYEVIRKTDDLGTKTDEANMYMIPGLGATMFAISFGATDDDNVIADSMHTAIDSLASPDEGATTYHYHVTTAAELTNAFTSIGNEVAYAASNARFVDQMGDDFNLQMTPVVDVDGNVVTGEDGQPILPKIEILSYDIYTRQDYLDGTITEDKIGDRKGTSTVLETVTFTSEKNGDGSYTVTGAYSDKIDNGATNILIDGVICASTFWYNTTPNEKTITGVNIPTKKTPGSTTSGSTNVLPSETFYWKLGTVNTTELALRYYVYLEGSMEGTLEGGSYPTNEYAILYYDNYLENPVYKETISPVMPWKEANVSYAFYLVNTKGEIIVNQTTGETGSFANKIAVTNTVLYKKLLLNTGTDVDAQVVASEDDVLPKYYQLYDSTASYSITIKSNSSGSWTIVKGDDKVASTYVTQFDTSDPSAYSNALSNNENGDDYTHTVVWFAVVWSVQAHPDTVVVDYGLPVDITVLQNDMFGDNGKLAAIGSVENLPADYDNGTTKTTSLNTGFSGSYNGTYGSAAVNEVSGKVRYTPGNMQMDGYEKFAYAVKYSGTENAGYYYDTITVIPATTIYYEDSFLTFAKYNTNKEQIGTWDTEGTLVSGATQAEDRPSEYSIGYTDANNIYGFDGAYTNMSTFSLGQARKVHVDANSYATAEFTFTGTGFDVISMTSNTTGTLTVQVYNHGAERVKANVVKSFAVDTYYGYTRTADGEWVATPDTENALYQIPVIQIENLAYGCYDVVIKATYASVFDHTTEDGYDLYLDAVRIYDPANDGAVDSDNVIEDAYKADGEGWPSYIELRNSIIAASSFDNVANDALEKDMAGLIFIDGDAEVGDAQITDYVSYGPNNEVYLAPGQRVAFILNTPANIDNVHIGLKSADGKDVTYTITNIAQNPITGTEVKTGDYYGAKTNTLHTTTDMYYDLTGWKGDIIVISNTGDRYGTSGILSITNIKSTYTSAPTDVVTTGVEDDGTATASEVSEASEVSAVNETTVYMTPAAATMTLRTLNRAASVEPSEPEETIPETTEPEVTEPAETEPEVTEPEVTEPAETEPVATEPETTEPEETEPEVTEPEIEEVKAFEPKTFRVTLSGSSVKVGASVIVTVTTGTDVAALTVNGQAVATYTESRWTKTRTWIVRLDADEIGEMEIAVVAYNAESVASAPVVNTVTVKEKGRNSIGDVLSNIFGWLFR